MDINLTYNSGSLDTESPVYRAINGTLPIVFYVHQVMLLLFLLQNLIFMQADQIGAVLDFKDEFELNKVIILGGAEAALLADQLAQAGIPIII